MKRILYSAVGILLILGAVFGVIISLAGLVGVWSFEHSLSIRSANTLNLFDDLLSNTLDALTIMDGSLLQAQNSLKLIHDTTLNMGETIHQTTPTVNNAADLIGKDLTDVVNKTILSLDSAAASAKLIDDTLKVLTMVPLLGAGYSPKVPLHESISEISASLSTMPPTFSTIQKDLQNTALNLTTIETNLAQLAESLQQITTSLDKARSITARYQTIIQNLQTKLTAIRENLPTWLRVFAFSVTAALIWLIIAQFGLLTQGLDLLTHRGFLSPKLPV